MTLGCIAAYRLAGAGPGARLSLALPLRYLLTYWEHDMAYDPLSRSTRAARRNLVATSCAAIVVGWFNLPVTAISALGINNIPRHVTPVLFCLSILYFAASFLIYARDDYYNEDTAPVLQATSKEMEQELLDSLESAILRALGPALGGVGAHKIARDAVTNFSSGDTVDFSRISRDIWGQIHERTSHFDGVDHLRSSLISTFGGLYSAGEIPRKTMGSYRRFARGRAAFEYVLPTVLFLIAISITAFDLLCPPDLAVPDSRVPVAPESTERPRLPPA